MLYKKCYMVPGYVNRKYVYCDIKPDLPKITSNNHIIDNKKCYLIPGYVNREYVYCNAKPDLPTLVPNLNNDYKERCYTYTNYVNHGYSVCETKPDLPKSLISNNLKNCYAEPKYHISGYTFCNMSKNNSEYDNCYMTPGYINRGYAKCLSKPNLPQKPEKVELFLKKYKVSYRGAPGVIINEKIEQKTQNRYKFVTSIVIESEQGDVNSPVFINTSKELLNIFGQKISNDMLYALSFLNYSPSLLVSRSTGLNSFNSSSTNFPKVNTQQFKPIRIDNYNDFESISTDEFLGDSTIRFVAQTPGTDGNLIKVALFTTEELDRNALIYRNYYAKDIIRGMDDVCYCVVVFKDDYSGNPELTELKEIFVIPFNDLESINKQSRLVYCRMNGYNSLSNELYNGNTQTYSGNLVFADGNNKTYFYGYDGDITLWDGQIVLIDGDVFRKLEYVIKFYGSNLLNLSGGISTEATKNDLEETAIDLNNKLNYNIDLHIGNNVTLSRTDCVNIVGTPNYLIMFFMYMV